MGRSNMINVLFYLTGKPGTEQPLRELLLERQRVSREVDGAIQYTFLQQKDAPAEWALIEQWRDKAHLVAHTQTMVQRFGAVPEGASLPAQLHALVEKSSYRFYRALE